MESKVGSWRADSYHELINLFRIISMHIETAKQPSVGSSRMDRGLHQGSAAVCRRSCRWLIVSRSWSTTEPVVACRQAIKLCIKCDFACIWRSIADLRHWGMRSYGGAGNQALSPHLLLPPLNHTRDLIAWGALQQLCHVCTETRFDPAAARYRRWWRGRRLPWLITCLSLTCLWLPKSFSVSWTGR